MISWIYSAALDRGRRCSPLRVIGGGCACAREIVLSFRKIVAIVPWEPSDEVFPFAALGASEKQSDRVAIEIEKSLIGVVEFRASGIGF